VTAAAAHPALVEGAFDDRLFNLFDGHRRGIDGQYAGFLAGGRAEAAGKLGKVVGGHELFEGVFPAAMVDRVVPVGDAVAQWTAGVAGGHPAVHAAGGLVAQCPFGKGLVDFLEIPYPLFDRPPVGQLPVVLHESRWFSHDRYPFTDLSSGQSGQGPFVLLGHHLDESLF
jgi:hypothetical protein